MTTASDHQRRWGRDGGGAAPLNGRQRSAVSWKGWLFFVVFFFFIVFLSLALAHRLVSQLIRRPASQHQASARFRGSPRLAMGGTR